MGKRQYRKPEPAVERGFCVICSTNLQPLCANCHRLKTYESKDWETR